MNINVDISICSSQYVGCHLKVSEGEMYVFPLICLFIYLYIFDTTDSCLGYNSLYIKHLSLTVSFSPSLSLTLSVFFSRFKGPKIVALYNKGLVS